MKDCADDILKTSMCKWEHLPQENFPVIFHGVNGRDQREGNSPSFFNPEEASIVHSYVVKILETRKNRVAPKDIGIITPYRKQVIAFPSIICSYDVNSPPEQPVCTFS